MVSIGSLSVCPREFNIGTLINFLSSVFFHQIILPPFDVRFMDRYETFHVYGFALVFKGILVWGLKNWVPRIVKTRAAHSGIFSAHSRYVCFVYPCILVGLGTIHINKSCFSF